MCRWCIRLKCRVFGAAPDCYYPTVAQLDRSGDIQACREAQTQTGGREAGAGPPGLRRRVAYSVVIAIILVIYSYPAVRTALTTRCLRLPAVSAPDLGLYLSISKLEKSPDGALSNPYYHIRVPYAVSYLKFRSGPALFGLLNRLFEGRIWLTLFVWNLLWWFLLCLAAIWLFDRFLPSSSVALVLAGVCLLTLFSVEGFGRVFSAWTHLSPAWLVSWLPYIRPFAPQIIVPLLVCYLGIQIRALSGASLRVWSMMAFLQFAAFTAFPYATLMMAGTTAVAAIWYAFAGPRNSWRVLLGFLLVCGFADIAFALHGSGGFRLSFPDQSSLIRFQPSLLGGLIGKLWFLTGVLVVAIALSRKLSPDVKWPLLGMGLTNMLFKLGDAFVTERVFFLSDHMGYFFQSTIIILFVFLVSAYIPRTAQALRLTRIACLAIVILCSVSGLLIAEGNYRTNLPYNLEQADLANWMERGKVSSNDLVITQFETTHYDDCEWIPLLSEAEVLYCRNAQLTLTPEQNREVQRFREVLYLYFDGKDHQWLESTTHFERYGFYGEVTSFRNREEQNARIMALRKEMLPFFDQIEHQDPSVQAFFRRFQRVWIIQNRENPAFVNERLGSYLGLKEQETDGSLVVTPAEPR